MSQVEEENEEGEEGESLEPEAEENWGGAQIQLQKGRPAKPTLGMWLTRPAVKLKNGFNKLAQVDEEEEVDTPDLCDSDSSDGVGECECCSLGQGLDHA